MVENWRNQREHKLLTLKWTKLCFIAARRGDYGKFAPVILPDHSQTRKFVQFLASDPRENKSLWSNSCPMTASQGGFPKWKTKTYVGGTRTTKLFYLLWNIRLRSHNLLLITSLRVGLFGFWWHSKELPWSWKSKWKKYTKFCLFIHKYRHSARILFWQQVTMVMQFAVLLATSVLLTRVRLYCNIWSQMELPQAMGTSSNRLHSMNTAGNQRVQTASEITLMTKDTQVINRRSDEGGDFGEDSWRNWRGGKWSYRERFHRDRNVWIMFMTFGFDLTERRIS